MAIILNRILKNKEYCISNDGKMKYRLSVKNILINIVSGDLNVVMIVGTNTNVNAHIASHGIASKLFNKTFVINFVAESKRAD